MPQTNRKRRELRQQCENDGNGADHRREIGDGNAILIWLKKHNWPEGVVQVLCANCNYSKAHYGYCPHHPDREVNEYPRKKRLSTSE